MQRMWASRRSCKAVIAELQLRRPRRAAGRHRRAPRVGPQRRPAGRPGLPRRRRRGAAAGDRAAAARATARQADKVGVHVEGLDDVLVRLANCCTPVPGDEIIGFVTRGRGVSVHRADCANAVSLMSDHATRLIEVDWDGEQRRRRCSGPASRSSPSTARGCCATSPTRCRDHHVNIVACDTATGNDRVAKMRFEFELADPGHLAAVLRTIKQIDAVYDAYRLVPARRPAR